MAKGFRIPRLSRMGGNGSTMGIPNKYLLLGGGIAAVGALYYILAGKTTGIAPFDAILEPLGDLTGLEGRGSALAPQLFGSPTVPAGAVPPTTPVKPVGGLAQDFSGGYFGQSYATYPEGGGYGISQAYLADVGSGYEDWYSNTSGEDDRISIS